MFANGRKCLFKLFSASCFFNSPQNFSTRECAHRNDTQKICIFSPTQRPLINIHCNNKDRQILCKLEYGWTFFCVCKPLQKNKFYLYSTSKYILIPVQGADDKLGQFLGQVIK